MLNINIKIDNDQDLTKFYHNIYLYRTPLFRLIKFNLENNNNIEQDNLSRIITALNIKKRRKRITCIYEQAIKELNDFYQAKDICQFKNNQCLNQRITNSPNKNGCCRLCEYRSKNGCTTENIACKCFNCSAIKEIQKTLEFEDLKILKVLTLLQRYVLKSDFFSTKEQVINDLYYGVIFIPIRIPYRFIKYFIKVKIKKRRCKNV